MFSTSTAPISLRQRTAFARCCPTYQPAEIGEGRGPVDRTTPIFALPCAIPGFERCWRSRWSS
ncbi:hypothetical protein KCP69_12440 [Salmonella enterica subsp. enterica]|nr:hypothetical protein KCP69_12440 [Salmonella enterica subsp. enterica]